MDANIFSDVTNEDFIGLGMYTLKAFSKTASEQAEESLFMDHYYSGFELGMGLDNNMESITKTASRSVGREIMGQFIPVMFLNK